MKLPLILVILTVVAVFGYLVGKSSVSPVSSTNLSTPAIDVYLSTPLPPKNVVEGFYYNHINCINNHFEGSNGKSPDINCSYNNKNLTSNALKEVSEKIGGDPILCSQNTPVGIKVDQAVVSGDTATVLVHTYYSQGGDNPIDIELVRTGLNSSWQINKIKCNY